MRRIQRIGIAAVGGLAVGDDGVDGAAVLELGRVDQGVTAFVGSEAADEGGAGGAG